MKNKIIISLLVVFILFSNFINSFALSETEIEKYTNFANNVIDFSYYTNNNYSYCLGNSWDKNLFCYFAKSSNAIFAFHDYAGNVARIGAYDRYTHEKLPLYLAVYNTLNGSLINIDENTDNNNNNNCRWNGYNYGSGNSEWFGSSGVPIIIKSNTNVYKDISFDNIIYKYTEPFVVPSITTNKIDFKYWNFNSVMINGGSFDLNKGELKFVIEYYTTIGADTDSPFQSIEKSTIITLNKNSYYVSVREEKGQAFFTASIPRSELLKDANLRDGAYINYRLLGSYYSGNLPNGESNFYFEESGIALCLDSKREEDIQKEKESQERQELIDNQKETNKKLDEQNETNKGIWDTLKSVLNFINPFSEDFFVYKLIELLLDMLKSLFIPSDDFFTNWLDDLNSYFGDVFGIVYFPFEILINFLNRISTINSSVPIITIPSFNIEFMGYNATFLNGFSYNFNDLLVNDTFENIHTIYLGVVDVILWLSVIFLASKCLKNILGGITDETIEYTQKNNNDNK